jgi:F-type H+-transporting ATPase subunit b
MITFNTNLLETNVLNLAFVIGVLATLGKDAFFLILQIRQQKIIDTIEEIQNAFSLAQDRLQTAEDRLVVAEQEAEQIREDLEKDLKALNFIDFQKEEDQNKKLQLDFEETFQKERGKLVSEIKDKILYSGFAKAEERLIQTFQSTEKYSGIAEISQIHLETTLFRFFNWADLSALPVAQIPFNLFVDAFKKTYPDEKVLRKTKKKIRKFLYKNIGSDQPVVPGVVHSAATSDKVSLKTSLCQRRVTGGMQSSVERNLFKSETFTEPSYFNTSGRLIVNADAFRLSFKCPESEKVEKNPPPTNVVYYFSFMWFACYLNQNKLMAYKRISDDGVSPSDATTPPTFTQPTGDDWRLWTVNVSN